MAAKTNSKSQLSMFGETVKKGTWTPPSEFPNLSGAKRLWLDCETDSNKKFETRPCGVAIATEDRSWYFPFGHEEGGNLEESAVRRFVRDSIQGKRLSNINMGFDAETLRNWEADPEELGCELHDVSYAAALIDENRFKGPNLDELAAEFLKDGRKKVETGVRPEDIHKVHSSLIGPYAEGDVELARDVDLAQQKFLDRDKLWRVMNLEDRLIYANNHMERSGMRLDVPKLEAWRSQAENDYAGLAMDIWMASGVKLRPNAAVSWHELFGALGLDRPTDKYTTRQKKNSYGLFMVDSPAGYTDDFLKRVQNKHVQAGLRMRRIASIQSKYLEKYAAARQGDKLPFHLYQLRASEDDYGTVVGRYSSANVNIQQVFKVGNQLERFGDIGFIIRELMIPDDGYDLFAVDGSQLQFRLFAHYSNDKDLIGAYRSNPDVDFHQMVADLFHLTRQAAKHNNFAMVLGMGREKLADRLGLSCTCRDRDWWSRATRQRLDRDEARRHIFGIQDNHDDGCPAIEANKLADQYEESFPAAKSTMEAVSGVAEKRGWVQTLLGRRRRFKDLETDAIINYKFYSAFASLLQGSEADMVKSKIWTLYNERKTIGIPKLRAPVHDEVTGDIERSEKSRRLFKEACEAVEEGTRLQVPMIWEAKFGKNWKDMPEKLKAIANPEGRMR